MNQTLEEKKNELSESMLQFLRIFGLFTYVKNSDNLYTYSFKELFFRICSWLDASSA